jgi:hypothetical protein
MIMFLDLDLTGGNGDSGNVPLKVGDRVVWILDTQPEQGVVRWLGHLDGHTLNDLMAGVEFVSAYKFTAYKGVSKSFWTGCL